MNWDNSTTMNAWISKPGPIDMRIGERRRDPPPAAGIILAVVTGAALLAWTIVLIRVLA